jgi:hypothetical protein
VARNRWLTQLTVYVGQRTQQGWAGLQGCSCDSGVTYAAWKAGQVSTPRAIRTLMSSAKVMWRGLRGFTALVGLFFRAVITCRAAQHREVSAHGTLQHVSSAWQLRGKHSRSAPLRSRSGPLVSGGASLHAAWPAPSPTGCLCGCHAAAPVAARMHQSETGNEKEGWPLLGKHPDNSSRQSATERRTSGPSPSWS